jgi:hypothetical protein
MRVLTHISVIARRWPRGQDGGMGWAVDQFFTGSLGLIC